MSGTACIRLLSATGAAAKDWNAAMVAFLAALRDTRNADIENYLGYAYRKSGQVQSALTYYQRALQLDPRHRGAREYIGEAYLMANNLTCEEYKDPQAGRRRLSGARCKVR